MKERKNEDRLIGKRNILKKETTCRILKETHTHENENEGKKRKKNISK